MNILFLTNDLYPYQNANSEIAYRVAHEISKYEHCPVSILGFNRSVDTVFPDPFKDIETIRMGAVTEYMHIVMTAPNAVKRILKFEFPIICTCAVKNHKPCYNNNPQYDDQSIIIRSLFRSFQAIHSL